MQQGDLTRQTAQEHIAGSLRFPAEDAGKSLADIVRRDLDAALQLLTDRAQYITGASGAAIALKRNGMNDMLCRASTGENAPELGALLSTEYGLSGESVRTRQALRCDDAEQDARVNREVCRQLGIASVVVMPVVHDDEVLGVFELFSGKANAFGERDLSAVQRLTEMVQTAVRLASAAERLPEKLNTTQQASESLSVRASAAPAGEDDILGEHILEIPDEQILEVEASEAIAPAAPIQEPLKKLEQVAAQPLVSAGAGGLEAVKSAIVRSAVAKSEISESGIPKSEIATSEIARSAIAETETAESETVKAKAVVVQPAPEPEASALPAATVVSPGIVAATAAIREHVPLAAVKVEAPSRQEVPSLLGAVPKVESQPSVPGFIPPKKKLFWSAALDLAAESTKSVEPDQSHVPPILRGLRKCEACGFPVSAGRVLCVECEEKRWRGQLRKPVAAANRDSAAAVTSSSTPASAAPSVAPAASAASGVAPVVPQNGRAPKDDATLPVTLEPGVEKTHLSEEAAPVPGAPAAAELVLSAGMVSSQSWISAHKYILITVLVAAALVAIVLLR